MMNPTEPTPLFELFASLRQSGLQLGIADYNSLLMSLQAGFGVRDRVALERICKLLWVRSDEDQRIFNFHFQRLFAQLSIITSQNTTHTASALSSSFGVAPSGPFPGSLASSSEGQTSVVQSGQAQSRFWRSDSGASYSDQSMVQRGALQSGTRKPHAERDEVMTVTAIRHATRRGKTADDVLGLMSDEYFPITRRQMKQSWRYLNRAFRTGPPHEIDVDATVEEIARQGFLLDPIMVPREVNRASLIILLDWGGSMVPFHLLERRLVETAAQGGRITQVTAYYFHNCPDQWIYADSFQQQPIEVESVMAEGRLRRSSLLIFSDAGAARGCFNLERASRSIQFLQDIQHYIRPLVWLNPVPASRWGMTTANEILRAVTMLECNRQGLDQTISILRGHLASTTGQELAGG